MKCPIPALESLVSYIQQVNRMLSLPWTPFYAQAPPSAEVLTSDEFSSFLGLYAMALTLVFTIGVFCLEHALDERQKLSYKSNDFPQDLANTVGKIDAENNATKKRSGSVSSNKSSSSKDGSNGKDKEKKEIQTDKPLLPQLESKFEKSQLYGSDKIHFSMISSAFGLVETTASLLCGLLPYTWDVACRWGEAFGWNEKENEIIISLLFLLISTLIGTVTSLPFELVRCTNSLFYISFCWKTDNSITPLYVFKPSRTHAHSHTSLL